jgi:phosphatidylglycerophosphatase A
LPETPHNRTTWAWTIGTFFGIGFLKPGSGTWASVPMALVWLFLEHHHGGPNFNLYWAIFCVVVTLVGIPASTIVARESGIDDPGHVVIDEVAGQAIALAFAPVFGWKYALAGFILFRAFDIIKPPPVRQLERFPRGWGIMMDDVAAGLLALVLLQIGARLHLFG